MTKFFKFSHYRNLFTSGHPRTLRAKKNILVSFISRIVAITINFIVVPLTLSYVGKVEYGIWMTLSSIIAWFSYFDIGLGNGLRNKLAEALATNDKETAKIYISSTYALISFLALLMFICLYIAAYFISWNKVFNTDTISNEDLQKVVIMVFFLFCTGFIFKLLSSLLQALQKYWIKDVIGIIAQLVGLAGIFILVKTTEGSLFNLCLIYAGKTPIVMLLASILLFSRNLSYLRPRILYVQLRRALPLINLGFRFFLNQIFYLIVSQSSLILVAQFFGPGEVTIYNLAVKYMTLGSMVYLMVLTPFLSAFTEAYTRKEYEWIRSTINKINTIWILTSVSTIILMLLYRIFFRLWVGESIQVPFPLILGLTASSIIGTFYNKYSLFLNGIGKIHLQTYLLGLQAFLFIPLSYLFYKLDLHLLSIVLAQIILHCIAAYLMYNQYKKIISQTATGVWNK
ncbi:MAG: oligosaccharide flippase family protein [Bacteroidetes bacterium]|nr:oligosaccharide flippase family protein [Bacteroidota bacterium]